MTNAGGLNAGCPPRSYLAAQIVWKPSYIRAKVEQEWYTIQLLIIIACRVEISKLDLPLHVHCMSKYSADLLQVLILYVALQAQFSVDWLGRRWPCYYCVSISELCRS